MRDIRPLRSKEDLDWAIKEIEAYFDEEPEPGSPEGDRFDVLAILIEAYEDRHYPIPPADPVEILQFAIRDMGRSQTELAELLGARSRASEILNRKRPLSLDQIRRISEAWKLPIEVLARPYRLHEDASA